MNRILTIEKTITKEKTIKEDNSNKLIIQNTKIFKKILRAKHSTKDTKAT